MNTKNNMYDIVSFEENIVSELEFAKTQISSLIGEARRAKSSGRKIDLSYFEEKTNKAQGALGASFSFAFKRNLRLEEGAIDVEASRIMSDVVSSVKGRKKRN